MPGTLVVSLLVLVECANLQWLFWTRAKAFLGFLGRESREGFSQGWGISRSWRLLFWPSWGWTAVNWALALAFPPLCSSVLLSRPVQPGCPSGGEQWFGASHLTELGMQGNIHYPVLSSVLRSTRPLHVLLLSLQATAAILFCQHLLKMLEMQIIIMWYHCTCIRMAKIQNSDKTKC